MLPFSNEHSDDIPSIWTRFENWIAENASHLTTELNAPASESDISKLEKTINSELPNEYVDYLRVHNGQNRDSEGIIDTEEFLSSERIINEWTVWKELLDKGHFNGIRSNPEKGIKDNWWNVKWIPITYDGNGNHYCIDLDPEKDGKSGQIIRMWHDSAERELIANSFKEWISNYVHNLEKGKYIYSEDWGGIISKDDL